MFIIGSEEEALASDNAIREFLDGILDAMEWKDEFNISDEEFYSFWKGDKPMEENNIMLDLDTNKVLEKSNMIHAFVYNGSLSEEIIKKRFEKTINNIAHDLGDKPTNPTNRKQRRKFMKKATEEYNKQSFVKCNQKDLFK